MVVLQKYVGYSHYDDAHLFRFTGEDDHKERDFWLNGDNVGELDEYFVKSKSVQ